MKSLLYIVALAGLLGCQESAWKIQGGPPQCEQMCTHWGLQFAAMVAVGDQAPRTDGATACVCVPAPTQPAVASGATLPASAGGATSATLAAPVAIAAARAARQASYDRDARRRDQELQEEMKRRHDAIGR
jgi:hypothetical protein